MKSLEPNIEASRLKTIARAKAPAMGYDDMEAIRMAAVGSNPVTREDA